MQKVSRHVLWVLAATLPLLTTGTLSSQTSRYNRNVTKEDLTRWEKELSNWGRWGKDDELGTLNLITPQKRKQAAALVKEGVSVSLAVEANTEKAVDNTSPYEISWGLGTDKISVSYHGIAHTHLDALSHLRDEEGRAYNGYVPDKDQVAKHGHSKNSIITVKNGIFTRGILMDIPRLKGVPYLKPGTPIYVEDLEAWEKKIGVKVSAGDALLVRTGRWAARKALGPYRVSREGKAAGLHASVIPWLRQRDITVLAGDGAQYVAPGEPPGAVHDFVIYTFGVYVLDDGNFEELAEACARLNRWEFLFTASPLPIRGGTGSPINPIATF